MWIPLALTTAVVTSINWVIFKHLTRRTHYTIVALGQMIAALPFQALIVFFWYRPMALEPMFWVGMIGSGLLNIVTTILSFKTLIMEDISFLAPIAAFNPLLVTFVSSLTLKEYPSVTGIVGIVLIGLGASLLGREGKERPHVSLLRLFGRKSVRYMLVVYAIWALTPTLEKLALANSVPPNPPLLSLGSGSIILFGLLPVVARRTRSQVSKLWSIAPVVLVTGLLATLSQIAAFTAFTLTNVGYATAVFKLNMLFTILLAHAFLKERVTARLPATIFMFTGVLLLAA